MNSSRLPYRRSPSGGTPKSKFGRSNRSKTPRLPSYLTSTAFEPKDQVNVSERYEPLALTSTGTGTVSQILPIDLASLTRFATQFLEIFDEVRINFVELSWKPAVGSSTPGSMVFYIERGADAIATSVTAAATERESIQFRPWDESNSHSGTNLIRWVPKQPTDYQFLSTSGQTLGSFMVVGSGLPFNTVVGYLQITSSLTFRGRNESAL